MLTKSLGMGWSSLRGYRGQWIWFRVENPRLNQQSGLEYRYRHWRSAHHRCTQTQICHQWSFAIGSSFSRGIQGLWGILSKGIHSSPLASGLGRGLYVPTYANGFYLQVCHHYLQTSSRMMQSRLRKRGRKGKWTYTHTIRKQVIFIHCKYSCLPCCNYPWGKNKLLPKTEITIFYVFF